MHSTVAILGANGQIGRRLTRELADAGLATVAVCRNAFSAGALMAEGHKVLVGSLEHDGPGLIQGCDAVVNCALPLGLPDQVRLHDQALAASLRRLASSCHVIHFSSVAVYNPFFPGPGWKRSGTVYGRRKIRMERLLRAAPQERITILRLGHVYGPDQWLSRFICTLIETPEAGLPFDGQRPSYGVHVRNVAAAARTVLARGLLGTHDVFDHPQRSWRELSDWHAAALQRPTLPGLDEAESDVHAQSAARAYLPLGLRCSRQWAAGLAQWPRSMIRSASTTREIADRILALRPRADWGARMVARYRSGLAAQAPEHLARQPEEHLMWRFEPQQLLQYASALAEQDQAELRQWHLDRTRAEL